MYRYAALLLALVQRALGAFSEDETPIVEVNSRVLELFNGEHFDDLLEDTPDSMRPASLVLFYDFTDPVCMAKVEAMEYKHNAETALPSRDRLLVTKYDTAASVIRTWYEMTPERNLPLRWGVSACPTLVYAPRACEGVTEWCIRGEIDPAGVGTTHRIGCDAYTEVCDGRAVWNGEGEWVQWANELVQAEALPARSMDFDSYSKQAAWFQGRDETTQMTHFRNNWLPHRLPTFTEVGLETVPIPVPMYDWLRGFYRRHIVDRKLESWAPLSTQANFHEVKNFQIDLDLEREEADQMANQYIKPVLEAWVGKNLTLTSFFGIREYYPGARLRNHVDRSTTHVISVTMCLERLSLSGDPVSPDDMSHWPLEAINWKGETIRYSHEPGYMVLYESARLPHGRPYPLPADVHTGAFLHYVVDGVDWEEVAQESHQFLASHSKRSEFISTPTVEPETVVSTTHPYGLVTRASRDSPETLTMPDGTEHEVVVGADRYSLHFANYGDKKLAVYWSGSGMVVQQCLLDPGVGCGVSSFAGHQFFFSTELEETAVRPSHSNLLVVQERSPVEEQRFVWPLGHAANNVQSAHAEL